MECSRSSAAHSSILRSPLWLGAIISGMAQNILSYARIGLLLVEFHASAWTATTHSFISLRPTTPCAVNNTEISRSDECRLLYLTERLLERARPLPFSKRPGPEAALTLLPVPRSSTGLRPRQDQSRDHLVIPHLIIPLFVFPVVQYVLASSVLVLAEH